MQPINFEIKKTNLYEEVAKNLEEMIVQNANMLGQKLPSEQSLANSFGVSRNVIRESMKLLKERGLITVRTGGGAYIARPESDTLTSMIARFVAMEGTDDVDVFDMRALLEVESCRLATARCTDADLDALEHILRDIELYYEDHARRTELDIRFHTCIAEISGNRLLALFVHSMADLLQSLIHGAMQATMNSDSVIPYHSRILNAMRARDVDLAASIMKEHLEESRRRYMSVPEAERTRQVHSPRIFFN